MSILSFFFLTIPRQPRSTLFPYTTLFRSRLTGGRGTPRFAGRAQVNVFVHHRAGLCDQQREREELAQSRAIPTTGQELDLCHPWSIACTRNPPEAPEAATTLRPHPADRRACSLRLPPERRGHIPGRFSS